MYACVCVCVWRKDEVCWQTHRYIDTHTQTHTHATCLTSPSSLFQSQFADNDSLLEILLSVVTGVLDALLLDPLNSVATTIVNAVVPLPLTLASITADLLRSTLDTVVELGIHPLLSAVSRVISAAAPDLAIGGPASPTNTTTNATTVCLADLSGGIVWPASQAGVAVAPCPSVPGKLASRVCCDAGAPLLSQLLGVCLC